MSAPLRILHTADWHLGQTLRGFSREHEHAAVLRCLLELIEAEAVDALLIAGDIFDVASPSAAAIRQWSDFLTAAHRRRPKLDIVAVAGNHDAPARLDMFRPWHGLIRTTVVGSLPWNPVSRRLEAEQLLAPLRNAAGEIAAVAVAIPFLRPYDLRLSASAAAADDEEATRSAIANVYEQAADAARKAYPGTPIVALGHLTLQQARTTATPPTAASADAANTIVGGLHGVDAESLFAADDIAYVALGHLHVPQAVTRDTIRYSGSLLATSTATASLAQQVTLVDLDPTGETPPVIREVPLPRPVPVHRVPAEHGAAVAISRLGEAFDAVGLPAIEDAQLPAASAWQPYVALHVEPDADSPEPQFRSTIRAAVDAEVAARGVRVHALRIHDEVGRELDREEAASGSAGRDGLFSLADLTPQEVFARRWREKFGSLEIDAEVTDAFASLLAEAHAGTDDAPDAAATPQQARATDIVGPPAVVAAGAAATAAKPSSSSSRSAADTDVA